MYERVGRVWGAHGFKRPQSVVSANNSINLKTIEENYDIWISEGIATKKGKIISVDLKKMGYDKLLGTGSTEKTYKLTVNSASAKAVQKIESAGGEVING
tara:strand:- start:876 stop:1175 length:300 start_codon:yes stop_codon:yes gene_type:complete